MNRILTGLLSLAFLIQVSFGAETTKTDLTPIQAGRIANVVGEVLQLHHFRQTPLNDQISENFLTNYLNSLDYNHMIFLQSDVDDFMSKYATRLDDATKNGDARPATLVYGRYLERLSERNILVQKLLKQQFDFSTDENFMLSRNKEPWPKDDAEAAKLWRQRIKYELLQGRLSKEKPEETVGIISRRYNRLEKTMTELETEDILQMYLTSLAHAYDPHSDYMSPSEAQNFEIQHINLSLIGIGAQLVWEDGYTKIKELIPGGPAAISKQLRPGDKIVAVAQGDNSPVDVVEMRLNKVVDMIRGKKGTEVKLTIVPAKTPDTKKVISLIRNEIQFKQSFAKAKVFEVTDETGKIQKLGVINLPQFYDNCAAHVDSLIQRLKKEKIEALILDLRHNGGGILDEAVQLTGLFVKKGPVVQVKEPNRKPHVLEDRTSEVSWDGPLIVAVGKLSASASEIVAAALQDYGRALIVGDQTTHGKGSVQQVLSLDTIPDLRKSVPSPGKLKLTVSKFYRINGSTTQKQGVTPDVILPSLYDYLDIGEASLENCLPADQTTAATYTKLDMVKQFVSDLQKASKERISHSKDFSYLLEDIDQVKKRQEEKSISLNEKARLEEKDQDKARLEARKKERATRVASTNHIFELDLDMVEKDQPLQPFVASKSKEDAELAQASAAKSSDPELDDETDSDVEPAIDPQLDETLNILRDYLQALKKEHKTSVVLKSE